MRFYLAPMEGITGYVFRNAYYKCFGDIDCYFTPFIGNKKMSARERRDILPENNKAVPLIPQILTNCAEDFLLISGELERLGYDTVNLNLGCPSGTVTARGRGAGFLGYPLELDAFLYEIFDKCPLKISIKTRIGVSSADEWGRLLDIYKKYPIAELIIHPRLQTDFYKNHPNREAYALAAERLDMPLCYNGDIVSVTSYQEFVNMFPDTTSIMIGRGILRRPWLVGQIRENQVALAGRHPRLQASGVSSAMEKSSALGGCCGSGTPVYRRTCQVASTMEKSFALGGCSRKNLIAFHDEIVDGYEKEMQGERNVLFRLKELWSYLGDGFADADKLLKKIRKSNHLCEYRAAADEILYSCDIVET